MPEPSPVPSEAARREAATDPTLPEVEDLDVCIVGAGLSGIAAASHLHRRRPGDRVAVLEAREAIGGTWDLFRYPGVRSDSDMYTLGYSFRPWDSSRSIADGAAILAYIRETAAAEGVEGSIRFRHRVEQAEWSSALERWTVTARRTDTGEAVSLRCRFLMLCTGYYRYDQGYTPELPGIDRFRGQVVHPQHWPEGLDARGKRVVVIGSGATAMTLVPALARSAAQVTMLQRSPTYVVALPGRDPIAAALRRRLPRRAAAAAIRLKNVLLTQASYQVSRRRPALVRRLLRRRLQRWLPSDFDVRTHFTPRYDPWDQRLCVVPDGDLLRALAKREASIETDTIETFTEAGIRLTSGKELTAEIVVTATGLELLALGGTTLRVDGEPVDLARTVGYRGAMLSGVPNLAVGLGYTNASWTLKVELVCQFVCRLLDELERRGAASVRPRWPGEDLPDHPFIDLTSGYVLRAVDQFPRQGDGTPWRLHQSYLRDLWGFRRGRLDDAALEYAAHHELEASGGRREPASPGEQPAAASGSPH